MHFTKAIKTFDNVAAFTSLSQDVSSVTTHTCIAEGCSVRRGGRQKSRDTKKGNYFFKIAGKRQI